MNRRTFKRKYTIRINS